jgi:hypothetical protein
MNDHKPTTTRSHRRWGSRREACDKGCFGPTKLHDLINRELIIAKKLDGKTLIDLDSIDALFESLPSAGNSRAA